MHCVLYLHADVRRIKLSVSVVSNPISSSESSLCSEICLRWPALDVERLNADQRRRIDFNPDESGRDIQGLFTARS